MAQRFRRMQEQIGRRLALSTIQAENSTFLDQRQQAGRAERHVHLLRLRR
jgi:hypothetical protein